jgi:hypothetical protein
MVAGSESNPATVVVQFLVPVYDREGRPYPRAAQKQIRRDLEQRFGGWSLAAERPLEGAWRNPASGEIEYDESWRYEIGLDRDRLAELDAYLGELAYRLGQAAMWRVVYAGGAAAVIFARGGPSK